MNKRSVATPGSEVRLMDLSQLQAYLGLGRSSSLKFGLESGAVKKYGRRTLYDRRIIDRAIDQLETN